MVTEAAVCEDMRRDEYIIIAKILSRKYIPH